MMFDPSDTPRLFALPPGVDFVESFVGGLSKRAGDAPDALSRVTVFVNTRRMARRMRAVLDAGPPRLLPRIRVLTELDQVYPMPGLPPPAPHFDQLMELLQLVRRLMEVQPDIASEHSAVSLAESLATLMAEMHSEGVTPEQIAALDVEDQSGHWMRALQFLTAIRPYFEGAAPTAEARQRRVVDQLIDRWTKAPPVDPIIVAGSTASRGTTKHFIEAVSRLPQGAVVLPGFDFDMPEPVWAAMDDEMTSEDHPQFRFARLMRDMGLSAKNVLPWDGARAPCPARNKLISLSLRPAPVTDQWMRDGPGLDDLAGAVRDVTLLEATSAREEAVAIALRLRKAAEDGITAALITPDRVLTRQVTAALDRWGIEPDDSAGRPLPLSAPGRFLRHVAALFGQDLSIEALLTLLKHPLTATGTGARGDHLRWTRELELVLRKSGPAFPTGADLIAWAAGRAGDGRGGWAAWLSGALDGTAAVATRPLTEQLRHCLAVASALAAGPGGTAFGALWEKKAGEKARAAVDALNVAAPAAGPVSVTEFTSILNAALRRDEVRDPVRPHPNIMIWGTLEARVQGADLVILGGLSDGVWPELPTPDHWLNRQMRKEAGLLLPERRIGLSAHDFQQAVAAKEVWLTRPVRSADAETVPSRWLNRLVNLLSGLTETGGPDAVKAMCARGEAWLATARALEADFDPVPSENRPAPCPAADQRPRRLSVTSIQTLIRDPYAIYARYVLKLRQLDPIRQEPDAPLRGIIIHDVLERFIKEGVAGRDALMQIAEEVMAARAPWPAMRRIWLAKFALVADWFVETEALRRLRGVPEEPEQFGQLRVPEIDFTLVGKADRFDRTPEGTVIIYDYKTGKPPSPKERELFDKQLPLEAAMVERGAFIKLGAAKVAAAEYIGLHTKPAIVSVPLDNPPTAQVWAEFLDLISVYSSGNQGYAARRAISRKRVEGEYDQLSRFGEWDETALPIPEKMP